MCLKEFKAKKKMFCGLACELLISSSWSYSMWFPNQWNSH